eukprot:TRINITY_DN26043_c0_g1_i1.p1 TRINITY_DN26043_c0_g1~~TRINITY_DN26043_c0_g1_i1.p1  ORF type:complete len:734 (+),score=181.29 TRINITY_DN26043_c0_g1_i1:94-2295(+)
MESDGSEADEQKKKEVGDTAQRNSSDSDERAEKTQAPDQSEQSSSSKPVSVSAEEPGNPLPVEAKQADGEEKVSDSNDQKDDQMKEEQKELDVEKNEPTPTEKGKDVVSRITQKWNDYVKERQDAGEESFASDRLSASSEYRKFTKEQDLGLDPGEAMPSFTEVWLAMNSSKLRLKASAPKTASSSKTSEGRARLTAKAQPKWFSAREALQVLAGGLQILYKRIGGKEISNGSKVIDAMQQCDREFSARQTPFERLGELLQVVHDDGWIELRKHRNGQTIRILNVPERGVDHLVGDWDEKHKAKEDGARSQEEKENRSVRIVSAEENRSSQADDNSSRDPNADPLAEFAAEASATYKREGSTALALRLDDTHERAEGDEGRRNGEADDKVSKRDRDDADGDSAPRFTLSAPAKMSQTESLRLFEDALKDLCATGLPSELPLNASVVMSHLLKRFQHFHISQTPFDKFSDLVEEAASQGIIKVTRAGPGRRDHSITWIKYRYRVLKERRRERPSGGGSGRRRRPSRSRRQASGHRHRGGLARERGRRSRSGGRERRERRGGGEGRERRGGERRGERRGAAGPESRGAQSSGKRDRDSKIASKKERESKRTDKSKDKLMKDAEKDRDKEKAKRREKEKEKEKDKVKEREKEKDKSKVKRKDKDKEKAKDKDKDKEEEKDKQKGKKRGRESESSSYEYYSYYSEEEDEYEEEDEESSSSSESSAKPEKPAKAQKQK